jgi:hypothetical protein
VGLQYVVCSPATVETLVNTGVFNFTLAQTSVTLGLGGSLGIAGGVGAAGGFGACGAPETLAAGIFKPGIFKPGIFTLGIFPPGIAGMAGLLGGVTGGKV